MSKVPRVSPEHRCARTRRRTVEDSCPNWKNMCDPKPFEEIRRPSSPACSRLVLEAEQSTKCPSPDYLRVRDTNLLRMSACPWTRKLYPCGNQPEQGSSRPLHPVRWNWENDPDLSI